MGIRRVLVFASSTVTLVATAAITKLLIVATVARLTTFGLLAMLVAATSTTAKLAGLMAG